MELLLEAILRPLFTVFMFVIWDILFLVVAFSLGRVFLLSVTFGRYPRAEHLDKHKERISVVGMFLIFGVWVALAVYNNYFS